jgi:DNA repair photolyase
MVAPILPAINDAEIEAILKRAHEVGARDAAYVLLRLPLEISGLFQEWLQEEFPDRASRVMKLMRSMRGGKDYVAEWADRHTGTGPSPELIAQRFQSAPARLGKHAVRKRLRPDLFSPPPAPATQCELFKTP